MFLSINTSNKIRLITSAAASILCSYTYLLLSNANPPIVQGPVATNVVAPIATATTTDIVTGNATYGTRIDKLSAYNDGSIACDCTFINTDGTNPTKLFKATLLPGESIWYNGTSWIHYGTNGEPYSQSVKLDAKLRVLSDVTNSTTSFADVTGLTVGLIAGRKYAFEAHLFHTNNATTTGSRFGVNIGATPTVLLVGVINTTTPAVAAASMDAGGTASLDTSPSGATTTGTLSPALAHGILSGFIQPSADGTFAIRCQSEIAVASGLVVKAGSWLRIWEVDN